MGMQRSAVLKKTDSCALLMPQCEMNTAMSGKSSENAGTTTSTGASVARTLDLRVIEQRELGGDPRHHADVWRERGRQQRLLVLADLPQRAELVRRQALRQSGHLQHTAVTGIR